MYKKHCDFYEMVKDWTISDFRTPGIKAEVIVDMLISDFIEDIIRYHFWNSGQSDVKLLVKELPIRISEKNYRNAKVDYLVSVGNDKLVLVELNTTNDSFDKRQDKRIIEAVDNGADELLGFYREIVELKNGNSSDRQKYKSGFRKYEETLSAAKLSEEIFKELDYLYISLTDHSKLPEKKKIILKDYCNTEGFSNWLAKRENGEERKKLWEKISNILLECDALPGLLVQKMQP